MPIRALIRLPSNMNKLGLCLGCEGWISMEKIWPEGDQRQSFS
jgi:hypothetical protein